MRLASARRRLHARILQLRRRAMRTLATSLFAASLAIAAPAAVQARGGSHITHHSDITVTKSTDKGSTKMMSRDAASGQASGKRMHKPYTAASKSTTTKKTPEKIEAGSENVRR
jgi:hypothetical protein